MNRPLVDYIFDAKKEILQEAFPKDRSYDFLPAFLELIEVNIDDRMITLSCKYSLKSLALILPFISKENRRAYGFIQIHLVRLARAIYKAESKNSEWERSWVRIENSLQDYNEHKKAFAELKRDYELASQSIKDAYKQLALKKQTCTRNKILEEVDKKAASLSQEFLEKQNKIEELIEHAKLFTVRVSSIEDLDLRKEIEQIVFFYATHGHNRNEFSEKYKKHLRKNRTADNKKVVDKAIHGVLCSLEQDGVITADHLPTGKISSIDDLKKILAERLGKSRWELCAYCNEKFYKIFTRGRAKKKYCDKPSCRTLAYRKRKREKKN